MKTLAVILGIMVTLWAVPAPSSADSTTWRQIYGGACDLNQAGKCGDALERAKIALQEAEKRFGPNSLNAVKSMELVAEITAAQGDRAEAARIYNRSLAVQEKRFGPSHPRVIKTMSTLADLNAEQARIFEARALYEKAVNAAKTANGTDSLDMAAPLAGLAKLHQSCGDYMKCREFCERILSICPNYIKYRPGLAGLVSTTTVRLGEVSALQEARVRE